MIYPSLRFLQILSLHLLNDYNCISLNDYLCISFEWSPLHFLEWSTLYFLEWSTLHFLGCLRYAFEWLIFEGVIWRNQFSHIMFYPNVFARASLRFMTGCDNVDLSSFEWQKIPPFFDWMTQKFYNEWQRVFFNLNDSEFIYQMTAILYIFLPANFIVDIPAFLNIVDNISL